MNISRWIHASSKALILSWRKSLPYRNQSTDLIWKSIVWFLFDKDLRHERVKTLFIHHAPKVCFLHVVKQNSFFFYCLFPFFYLALFFHEYSRLTRQQVKGKPISWYPFYHFHPLHRRHLDISKVIAAESSPMRIAGSRNRTLNLWYTFFRIHSFSSCTGNCCC